MNRLEHGGIIQRHFHWAVTMSSSHDASAKLLHQSTRTPTLSEWEHENDAFESTAYHSMNKLIKWSKQLFNFISFDFRFVYSCFENVYWASNTDGNECSRGWYKRSNAKQPVPISWSKLNGTQQRCRKQFFIVFAFVCCCTAKKSCSPCEWPPFGMQRQRQHFVVDELRTTTGTRKRKRI